ncbi:hypothetical protein A2U01_0076595, partial [Trifolium medium]|nr:hypothetical protein [Trifolium medium]
RYFRQHRPVLITASKNGKFPENMNSEKKTSIISIVQCIVSNDLFHQHCAENGTFVRFGREVTDDELMAEIKHRELIEIDDELRELKREMIVT